MAASIPTQRPATASQASEPRPGLIVREWSPRNLESPLEALGSSLTPVANFYVRSHFEVPRFDAGSWRLRVEGAIRNPFEVDLAELRAMPAESKTALLECAGNGRIYLVPKAKGLLWESGAVGHATWLGLPRPPRLPARPHLTKRWGEC